MGFGLGIFPLLTPLLSLLHLPSHPCCYWFEGPSLQAGCPEQCCVRLRSSFCHGSAFLFLAQLLNAVAEERNRPGYGLCRRCSAALTVYRLCASQNVSRGSARLCWGLCEQRGSCTLGVLQPLVVVMFCTVTGQRRFQVLCRSKGLGFSPLK